MTRSPVADAASTAWVALTFCFPLVALFEEDYPAIIGVPLAAMLLFSIGVLLRTPRRVLAALLGSIVLIALVYSFAAVLVAEFSSGEKLSQFGLVLIVFAAATGVCLSSRIAINYLPAALLVLGLIGIALIVLSPGNYQEQGRVSYGDSNPIWMARILGLAGLGGVAVLLRNAASPKNLGIACAAVILSSAGIFLTGSRGPLVALIAAVGLAGLLMKSRAKPMLIVGGLWITIMMLLLMLQWGIFESSRIFEVGNESSAIRAEIYSYSIDLVLSQPWGIGVGNFNVLSIDYPHNIFLEFLAEWGWLGGGLFIVWIIVGGYGIFSLSSSWEVLKLLYVYEVVNASLSGDITSPRYLYGLAVLGVTVLLWRTGSAYSAKRARQPRLMA